MKLYGGQKTKYPFMPRYNNSCYSLLTDVVVYIKSCHVMHLWYINSCHDLH